MVKRMGKYSIRYTETYQRWYDVEANSPEEAEEKLTNDICEGRENAPEECCDSGVVEIWDSEDGKISTEPHTDYMELFCEALPDYSEGNIWCDGGIEILCKTESAAQAVADLLELLYRKDGEEILINTGYYDPEEDKRNGEEDRYTGWYYVNVD